VAYQLPIV